MTAPRTADPKLTGPVLTGPVLTGPALNAASDEHLDLDVNEA